MKDHKVSESAAAGISRRKAVRLTAIGLAGSGLSAFNTTVAKTAQNGPESSFDPVNPLSNVKKKVQYEEMFPEELEIAISEFPVAYVPFGSLEWHGRHMPYGVDTLKAHGILIHTAEKFGGVVVPPTYWGHMGHWKTGNHPGLSQDLAERLFTEIFTGLVRVGFRVVIGVTGHDVRPQVDSLQKAVNAISYNLVSPAGSTAGFAMMEGSLNPDDPDVGMDHAAKWETSLMMRLRPELVDLKRIENVDRKKIEGNFDLDCGINGYDPRIYASAEVGGKALEKISDKIGQKAQELLKNVHWTLPG